MNAPADEVVEAAPITSPEAAPVVDPTPDAATTEQLPPATAEPADDKSGKRSKKSSKTKEKESKSKSKAKEKEKAREEKEKAKDKAKEKEKEKAKSSGKKKKGKAKVDSVALPNDEAGPTPDESCPPDASAVEIQADAVAAPAAETTIDPPTETPTDPPTESPTDPPTETPPEPVINSESSQSEGATANTEASSLDEKQNGPDQVSEPGNEAGTKDLTREGAITTPETEGNLNNESSTPITEEAKSSESANVKVATPNDSSEATQPSTGIDTNPTAPPTTNDDDVANDAPLDVSDTNPLSGPVNVEIVEVIEHIAKDKTPEASPSEVPNDMTPTPEATETKEEKIEVTQPLPKEEDPKAEEQPDLGPETEMAAVEPTSEPSATETIQETPQAEVLDESPPENTQAGDGKSEDQPIETSQAETTETAPQDPSLDGPSGSAPEAVKADDKKMEIVEPPLQSGDVKAEEQPIDVTQEGAAIVDTEATDSAIEAQIEEQPAADEPPTQVAPAGDEEKNDKVTTDWNEEQPAVEADKPPAEILPAVDNEKDDTAIEGRTQEQLAVDKPPAEIAPAADNENNDKAIEDLIQKQPTADELPVEMVTGLVDEKNDKTIVDQIQKEPAADQSPLEIVAVVVDEKAVEAAPAEIPPPVEPSAPVEQTSDPPCVDDAHKGEPIEQTSTDVAPSEPTLVEEPTVQQASADTEMAPSEPALVEEPNTGPVVESAPTADAPPSPNSEKHRRKKAAGWERPRGHSKTSTAGSDLNGSTTKTGPLSDKPASESTATKQKRHSNRRTFELNFGGKGTDHGSSDRPKISRAATSRRSHRREREPESAVKPRILERVKTEADGRVQYRVNDPAAERPSRRRGEESFRREHRSDKHRDGDRHREREREREREKERETEREKEREKEREEAKERERERERKRLEEEEERRERRRRRREEEDGRGKDGEGRERHHRHREHDRERRRRDPSPAPAKKTGKSFGSSLRKLLAI